MKPILILICLWVTSPFGALSQCVELQLTDLHTLQRAEEGQKDFKILDLGFDLRSEFQSRGATVKSYSKCWSTTIKSQPVYEQLIWWNQTTDVITWFTLNERHFAGLRRSIVERQSSGPVSENPDFYSGRLFQYRFGTQRVDGVEYFFVSISKK